MISTQRRQELVEAGLDVPTIEARLSEYHGRPVTAVDTVLRFWDTDLIVEWEGLRYRLPDPERNELHPQRSGFLRRRGEPLV